MYNPEKLGRIARTNNFEALEMMHESKKHAFALNDLVRELISRADELDPKQITELGLKILQESDRLRRATDEAVHSLFQNEAIFDQGAKRDPYETKGKENVPAEVKGE